MKLSLFVFDIQFRSTITIQLMNQQWHMEILQLFYFDNDFFFFLLFSFNIDESIYRVNVI